MQKYCLDCHSKEEQEGELDLEQFRGMDEVRMHPMIWVKVVEMMEDGEMPPKKQPQLAPMEREMFLDWVDNYLDAEALANAGDPGRVVARRLSNAEYTYTIQDLTGVELEPVKEFPVDGAAGEGFMNVGDAQGMSPALVRKYLDAAKKVAAHAVLTPDGIRFSLGTSRRDWVDELLFEIRSIYDRHTSGMGATDKVYAWDPNALDRAMNTSGRIDLKPYLAALVRHRDRLQKNPAIAAEIAREAFKITKAKYEKEHTQIAARLSNYERDKLSGKLASWLGDQPDKLDDPSAGHWWHMGPFKAKTFDEAFVTRFAPEHEKDIDVKNKLGVAKLTWKSQPEWKDGKVHNVLKGANSAHYLYREIDSPFERKVKLSLGSNDAVMLFLNNQPILKKKIRRAAAPDQEKLELSLVKGKNRLLLKIVNGGDACGFYFKLALSGPSKEVVSILNKPREKWKGHEFKKAIDWFKTFDQKWLKLEQEVKEHKSIAPKAKLNPKYFQKLAELLVSENPSKLLRRVCDDLRKAGPTDISRIAADISQWQGRLWRFGKVGQHGREGRTNPWMSATNPLTTQQEFRLKIPAVAKGEISVFLVAGDGGDGEHGDVVRWNRPRLVFKNQPDIPLATAKDLAQHMALLQRNELARTEKYLGVIAMAETQGKPLENLAKVSGLDARVLGNWMAAVQLGKLAIQEPAGHYSGKIFKVGGYEDIRGWGLNETPNLIANKARQTIRFGTLTVPGHSVNMHPSPNKEAIIYWQSPMGGRVKLKGFFADSDGVCGNGASWRVELINRTGTNQLAAGVFVNGKRSDFAPTKAIAVEHGDLIKFVVNARDRNHVCDTTRVSFTITEQDGKKLEWDLAKEVVDRIHESNPLADLFGNPKVWHFCSSTTEQKGQAAIPAGSTLAKWRTAVIGRKPVPEIEKLAATVQHVFAANGGSLTGADEALRKQYKDPKGPLRWLELVLENAVFEDIEAKAPAVLKYKLPGELVAGAELVVNAALHPEKGRAGTAQFLVSLTEPNAKELLDQSIVVGTETAKKMAQAYDDFRSLFPAAMCHAQIVPVDEAATMILYHREDEPLRRLMLSNAEAAKLDRLWRELFYVSQEPLLRVVSHEQLYEFATQDRKDLLAPLEALRIPTRKRAEVFRKHLKKTEPIHLAAVLKLAERAWRRPMEDADKRELRGLYETLRTQGIPHELAIRLVLARVLTSPAFLYRLEQPVTAKGKRWTPVSNHELACRLSYFLWSTMPDEELQKAMMGRMPVDDKTMVVQTKRMLKDSRTRRLAVEFACQWLGIRNFNEDDGKNEKLYPEFAELRGAMYEESVRFLEDIFRNDGSILDIIHADHTFLNETLAKHYGIQGVNGEQWRRVDNVQAKGRGGIFGMGTVLAKQSGASRTSPILRGNWVSETLLGERLPKPPANVPDLPELVPAGLTARQLIEKHSSVAACAKCHARIDPYGFALEQYDAIGRLRKETMDTKTKLMDGTKLEGLEGLRQHVAKDRRDAFVRQFCKKLLGYALGREVGLSDKPLLESMQEQLAKKDFRFSVAVEAIVTSEQFRNIRATVVKVD